MSNPVVLSGVIEGLLVAILGVINAWYPLTGTQNTAILALITAIVAFLTWWLTRKTLPANKPSDADGTPLVRADNQQPSAAAVAAGRYVVVDGPDGTSVGEARAGVRGRMVWNK